MWSRLQTWLKTSRTRSVGRVGVGGFAPAARPAGWWRDDHVEQLRNYQSWVYAADNAIAQEVARQRPLPFVDAGQADQDKAPLPHLHPLSRTLNHTARR